LADIEKIKKILVDHEKRIKKLEGKKVVKVSSRLVSQPTSIMGMLMELKEDGFFDKPKYLKDIVNELASRGYHYQITSLTNPIRRALRNKKLGRIGKAGKWQYVSR